MGNVFRPVARMFDFSGRSSRAEYFAFVPLNALIGWAAAIGLLAVTLAFPSVYAVLGRYLLAGPLLLLAVITFPWWALNVRRLRDQNARSGALAWVFIPVLGPVVLFFLALRPSFRDQLLTLSDGAHIWKSEQFVRAGGRSLLYAPPPVAYNPAARAPSNAPLIIAGVVAAAAMLAVGDPSGSSVAAHSGTTRGGSGRQPRGTGNLSNAQGGINQNSTIFGGRRAHYRKDGTSVKSSGNKYTW